MYMFNNYSPLYTYYTFKVAAPFMLYNSVPNLINLYDVVVTRNFLFATYEKVKKGPRKVLLITLMNKEKVEWRKQKPNENS